MRWPRLSEGVLDYLSRRARRSYKSAGLKLGAVAGGVVVVVDGATEGVLGTLQAVTGVVGEGPGVAAVDDLTDLAAGRVAMNRAQARSYTLP